MGKSGYGYGYYYGYRYGYGAYFQEESDARVQRR